LAEKCIGVLNGLKLSSEGEEHTLYAAFSAPPKTKYADA